MFIPMGNVVIGGVLPYAEYTAAANDGSNDDEFSFASVALGAAHTKRHIVVVFNGGAFLGVPPFTEPQAATIAGVSATPLVAAAQDPRQAWIAAVPTGTTGTITVGTAAGSDMSFGSIQVWATYHLRSAAAVDTLQAAGNPTATGTIDVSGGGLVIARAFQSVVGVQTFTWAGVTEDAAGTVGGTGANADYSGAHADRLAAETGRTISAQSSAAGSTSILAVSLR